MGAGASVVNGGHSFMMSVSACWYDYDGGVPVGNTVMLPHVSPNNDFTGPCFRCGACGARASHVKLVNPHSRAPMLWYYHNPPQGNGHRIHWHVKPIKACVF